MPKKKAYSAQVYPQRMRAPWKILTNPYLAGMQQANHR